MAQFKSSAQVGIKQDLSNIVKDITPLDTPFIKSLSSEKAENLQFNWVEKDVTTGTKAAVSEGADVVDAGTNYRTLKSNYTEIFAIGVEVSDTSATVNQAGGPAYAERVKDAMQQILRQKEQVYLNGQTSSGTITNRKTASLQAQVATALNYDKAGAAMTKAFLDTALQDSYDAGAMIDTVYCKPSMKRTLSTVLTFAPVVREAGTGKVVTDAVDVYQSDFGSVKIVIDRHILAGDIALVDSSMVGDCVLIPMNNQTIARTGLAEKSLVNTECGLKLKSSKGASIIHNVI